jgi:PAS domain-containing protein
MGEHTSENASKRPTAQFLELSNADTVIDRIAEPHNGILFPGPTEGDSRDSYFRNIVDGLPAAIYVTDAFGRITYFNEAAATLWGHRPTLGESEWCGSWKLFWPDGRALPHGECPMAVAIKEKRPVRGMSARMERACPSSRIRRLFSTLPVCSLAR